MIAQRGGRRRRRSGRPPIQSVEMHFTDAHEELRMHIRRFLEREVVPHLEEWEETTFPDSIMKRFGELGQGGDYFAAVVLSEEMARAHCGGLGMAVAVQAEMATPPVARFGTGEQKRRFLAPAIAGDAIAAIAMTEPDAGSDLAGMRTTARRFGNEYVINGRKTFITNGRRCHWCLLVTKTDTEAGHAGFSLFLVPKDTPGFHVARTLKKLGMHSSDTAELVFEDCRVGEEGSGWTELMWELQGERLIAACGQIAGARATFEYAMQYAKDRVAFGRPIAQFQVVKHRLVDMANKIAAVQALVYETCGKWDRGEYAVREISQAKLLASQVAVEVADEAI